MSFEEQTAAIEQSLKCDGCGAVVHYQPGSNELVCPYCGTRNTIAAEEHTEIKSLDYAAFVAAQSSQEYSREAEVVRCSNCGASTTLLPGVTADQCPFCASPLVINMQQTQKILKPHYVLPFVIEEKTAVANFRSWLGSLWFAPGDLLQKVKEQSSQQLKGIYIPYWSYDTDPVTSYRGQRGEY
jgi:LSD1 subclass zinc finger protein